MFDFAFDKVLLKNFTTTTTKMHDSIFILNIQDTLWNYFVKWRYVLKIPQLTTTSEPFL